MDEVHASAVVVGDVDDACFGFVKKSTTTMLNTTSSRSPNLSKATRDEILINTKKSNKKRTLAGKKQQHNYTFIEIQIHINNQRFIHSHTHTNIHSQYYHQNRPIHKYNTKWDLIRNQLRPTNTNWGSLGGEFTLVLCPSRSRKPSP